MCSYNSKWYKRDYLPRFPNSLSLNFSRENMNLNALLYLLVHYFAKERKTSSLIVMNCMSYEYNVMLLNRLSLEGFSVLILPVNESTNSSVDLLKFSDGLVSLGIFLDYTCVSSEKIIETVSISLILSHKKKSP